MPEPASDRFAGAWGPAVLPAAMRSATWRGHTQNTDTLVWILVIVAAVIVVWNVCVLSAHAIRTTSRKRAGRSSEPSQSPSVMVSMLGAARLTTPKPPE